MNKSASREYATQSTYGEQEFQANQKVAEKLTDMEESEPEKLESLFEKLESLQALLSRHNLRIDLSLSGPSSAIGSVLPGFIFAVLSPLVLYGWLNNLIPWTLMHRITDKVQETQFISSARMTLGLIFFPLFYLLQTLIVFFIIYFLTGQWFWCLVYLGSLPATGILAINWYEKLQARKQELRLFFLPDDTRIKMNNLIDEILSAVGI